MKVYVDELPKKCGKCCFGDAFCCINNNYILDLVCLNKKSKDCPLQSLTDYTKQVRKEVVQEIRNKIEQAKMIYEWKGKEITIEEILDQIQGETKC